MAPACIALDENLNASSAVLIRGGYCVTNKAWTLLALGASGVYWRRCQILAHIVLSKNGPSRESCLERKSPHRLHSRG